MRRVTLPAMPLPPEEWDRLADEYEAKARAAVEAGDVEGAAREARRARAARGVARELRGEVLQPQPAHGTVNSEMLSADHRLALSESVAKARKLKDKVFREAIRARGYTTNTLAQAAQMSPAALSQARKKKGLNNSRPIRRSKAQHIEKLTGWPADEAHWPGGIIED